MNEKEIRKFSSAYINTKEDIERQKKAKVNFEKALAEKVEEDFANRYLFLKYNAELTGRSLEFRNIHGIEGGVYEEKLYDTYPYIYPDGTPTSQKYDSYLLVEACGKISSTGEQQMSNTSPFFVDKLRDQESSPFHVPYCPPNLSGWCGDKWYKGFSKRFYKTEDVMYNFLNGLRGSGGSFSVNGIITGFSSNKEVKFYSDKNATILFDDYVMEANPSLLKAPGGGMYEPLPVGESINPLPGYTLAGSFSEGDVVSFRLTSANGINSNEIGYALIAKRSGDTTYFDLLSYDGALVSKATTYNRYKLWKFWQPIPTTNIQSFNMEVSKTIVKNATILDSALKRYQDVYIDGILHYLERITSPDGGTKTSIKYLKSVQSAFNTYWNNKSIGNQNNLFNKIEERINWLYNGNFNSVSQRATQIHNYLYGSDIFEKVYGTINSRINKRSGTLRELIKYAFNDSVAEGIMELKRESLLSTGDTIVVYPLTKDTDGTDGIEIELEEGEDLDSLLSYVKWMNEVIILSDNERLPFFKSRILDIKKRGDKAVALTLFDKVPVKDVYSINDKARLVKIF